MGHCAGCCTSLPHSGRHCHSVPPAGVQPTFSRSWRSWRPLASLEHRFCSGATTVQMQRPSASWVELYTCQPSFGRMVCSHMRVQREVLVTSCSPNILQIDAVTFLPLPAGVNLHRRSAAEAAITLRPARAIFQCAAVKGYRGVKTTFAPSVEDRRRYPDIVGKLDCRRFGTWESFGRSYCQKDVAMSLTFQNSTSRMHDFDRFWVRGCFYVSKVSRFYDCEVSLWAPVQVYGYE